MTPITGAFLILNTLIWLAYVYVGAGQAESWRGAFLIPAEFSPLPLFTSQFIHQSALHLALNMLLLWAFGRRVERGLGSVLFTVLYLGTGVFAGLLHVAVAHLFQSPGDLQTPASGASGAVAGVMGAYAAIYPRRRLRIPTIGIDVAGVTVILAWLAWEAAQAIAALNRGEELGVGHWAHVGGLVCGLVLGPAMYGGSEEEPGPDRTPRAKDTLAAPEVSRLEHRPPTTPAESTSAAVERLTRIGAKEHALALYCQSVTEGRPLPLPGPVEFRIAVWLAGERDWPSACDAFLSVAHSEPEPDLAASALWHAIELADEHLRRPQLAESLRQELRFRYPHTRWAGLLDAPRGGDASPDG